MLFQKTENDCHEHRDGIEKWSDMTCLLLATRHRRRCVCSLELCARRAKNYTIGFACCAQQKEASLMRLVAESVIEAVSHPEKYMCYVTRYNNTREIPRDVCTRCAMGRDCQWSSNPNFGHRPLFVVEQCYLYMLCVLWLTGIMHPKTQPTSARDGTPVSPFKCEPRKVELLVGRCRQTSRLC